MNLKFTFLSILIVTLTASCGPKLSGASEDKFISSREKMEENLSTSEKQNLEKAFRVVALYAMSEKWENPNDFTGKSFDDITLDVVNNKTYNNVVNFAEDYLQKENQERISKLKEKISELELERKKVDSVISKLETFKATDIEIEEGSWHEPTISVKIINTGTFTKVTEHMFTLEIYSITQDKLIDAVGSGGSSDEGRENGEDNFFAYASRSLSTLMERSKRLKTQLQDPQYPITDLEKYDLKVKVFPSKIVLKDGSRYDYPEKTVASFTSEIKSLENQITELESLNGTLDELELDEFSSEKEAVYNEEYLSTLAEIRKTKKEPEESSLEINKELILTFPVNYEVKKGKSPGIQAFYLGDSLTFDNSDKNLVQYQINDTTYVEYQDSYDKPNGTLNILEQPNVTYDIKETINSNKKTNRKKLIDADDTGYIYFYVNIYRLLRYIKIKDTHYLYEMDFKNLDDCVREFDRSKGMIK